MIVLVVAPHPDDETLGCGGTLLRLINEGHEVHWLIATKMGDGFSEEVKRVREREISKVAKAYDFQSVVRFEFPAAGVERVETSQLVAEFAKAFTDIKPEMVFVPNRSDAHSDHKVIFDAVAACTKWFRYPSILQVLTYETVSETEFGLDPDAHFQPNTFFEITGFLEKKIQILKAFESEIHDFPFPRSEVAIDALAKFRGSQSGYKAAEAFQLLRQRNPLL